MAERLWNILADIEKKHGIRKAEILQHAGFGQDFESTKRLPGYAINPALPNLDKMKRAKKLVQKISNYMKLCLAAEEKANLEKNSLVSDLLEGTHQYDEIFEGSDIHIGYSEQTRDMYSWLTAMVNSIDNKSQLSSCKRVEGLNWPKIWITDGYPPAIVSFEAGIEINESLRKAISERELESNLDQLGKHIPIIFTISGSNCGLQIAPKNWEGGAVRLEFTFSPNIELSLIPDLTIGDFVENDFFNDGFTALLAEEWEINNHHLDNSNVIEMKNLNKEFEPFSIKILLEDKDVAIYNSINKRSAEFTLPLKLSTCDTFINITGPDEFFLFQPLTYDLTTSSLSERPHDEIKNRSALLAEYGGIEFEGKAEYVGHSHVSLNNENTICSNEGTLGHQIEAHLYNIPREYRMDSMFLKQAIHYRQEFVKQEQLNQKHLQKKMNELYEEWS